eukprot:comp17788_c0_seq1/m.17839 comp17788_c0_seq1/g.17839  ORF comp17788_c0_seq1/g.17839 comp17788_c0_seq1/m.17839 type:complete len:179 (-) comp17788_c0_seq1:1040-1576(-)
MHAASAHKLPSDLPPSLARIFLPCPRDVCVLGSSEDSDSNDDTNTPANLSLDSLPTSPVCKSPALARRTQSVNAIIPPPSCLRRQSSPDRTYTSGKNIKWHPSTLEYEKQRIAPVRMRMERRASSPGCFEANARFDAHYSPPATPNSNHDNLSMCATRSDTDLLRRGPRRFRVTSVSL